MVRTYVRKSNRGASYTPQTLKIAVEQIKAKTLTVKAASEIYKIPSTTLKDHVKGRRGEKSSTFGRSQDLSAEAEKKIAAALCAMEKWGFGLSRIEVLDLVGQYVTANQIKTQFKNGRPSKDWFINFRKRHKLSIKKPQSVEIARKKMLDPFIIQDYFKLLKGVLDDLGLHDKPNQIFNLDESSFCVDPSKTKVVGKIGVPSTRTVSGPGRENTTALFACSAAGLKLPPLLIFKGKSVWSEWVPAKGTDFPNTSYAATKKGWMESDVFVNYIKRTFIPNIGTERPILLIYDGHSTHITFEVIELAMQEKITILKLPPHSSHLLQPLDLAVFRSIKCAWDAKLVKWQRLHPGLKIPKKEFSQLLGQVWLEAKPDILTNGFKKAGIYPFDDKVIREESYDPGSLDRWKKAQEQTAAVSITEDEIEDNVEKEVSSFSLSNLTHPINKKDEKETSPRPHRSTNEDVADHIIFNNPVPITSTANKELVSFESLLLETIKTTTNQNKSIKTPKRKVCVGSEIITSEGVLQRLKEKDETKKPLNKKKIRTEEIIETSSDEEEMQELEESEEERDGNILEEFENMEGELDIIKDVSEIALNDWALVQFASKKCIKHFIGQIVTVENGDIHIKYARKSNTFFKKKSVFTFPIVEDCYVTAKQDIVSILPPPNIGRRGEICFSVSFDNYNIQ